MRTEISGALATNREERMARSTTRKSSKIIAFDAGGSGFCPVHRTFGTGIHGERALSLSHRRKHGRGKPRLVFTDLRKDHDPWEEAKDSGEA